MSKSISKDLRDFENVRVDIETLESIARASRCNLNNFDWWEISQYIKDVCLEAEEKAKGLSE